MIDKLLGDIYWDELPGIVHKLGEEEKVSSISYLMWGDKKNTEAIFERILEFKESQMILNDFSWSTLEKHSYVTNSISIGDAATLLSNNLSDLRSILIKNIVDKSTMKIVRVWHPSMMTPYPNVGYVERYSKYEKAEIARTLHAQHRSQGSLNVLYEEVIRLMQQNVQAYIESSK